MTTDRRKGNATQPLSLERFVDEPELRASASATVMVEAALESAKRWQPIVNSYIEIATDEATEQARRVGGRGDEPPMRGLPVAVKDNIDVARMHSTAGSNFFRHHTATANATAVQYLRQAGAIIIGKTNMHEFAYGGTNDNPFFGRCRNPWDLERITGGSSGGSAVAVATDSCVVALGSDTGGSGRMPAAFCGVAGFRPSHGVISNAGVFPTAPSLDTISLSARHVVDITTTFNSITDAVFRNRQRIESRRRVPAEERQGGLKIGIVNLDNVVAVDEDISEAVSRAAGDLESLGHQVSAVDVPNMDLAFAACDVIMKSEVLAVHGERLAQTPERFSQETRDRLELAKQVSTDDLGNAKSFRARWASAMADLFADLNVLLLPTTPLPPPVARRPDTTALVAQVGRLTNPWSLAGLPALSIPCGVTRENLPIGVQLIGCRMGDASVLSVGSEYQRRTQWHLLRPTSAVGETFDG